MMTERISALRRRMIEDMNARGLSAGGQRAHIRSCKRFAAFLGHSPETATRDDIRRFQLHLAEEAVSIGTRNAVMSGVKFLFRVTLRRLDLAEEIYHLPEPQRAPVILSANEIKRLLAVARPLKAKVLLSIAYGTGMRASEVVRLKVGDIDSDQMIIRVIQGKGKKDRQVKLPKDLLGLLRAWWPVRFKRLDAGKSLEQRWLFPGIYVQSHRAGERVMASVSRFLTKKLRLKVDETKSAVARPEERQFLGFSLSNDESERRIAPKALTRFKKRVRDLTSRTKGVSLSKLIGELASYLIGWRGYFSFCQTSRVLSNLDASIRRRLRAHLWWQWQNGRKRFKELRRLGVPKFQAAVAAGSPTRCSRMSRHPAVQMALRNRSFDEAGLTRLHADALAY